MLLKNMGHGMHQLVSPGIHSQPCHRWALVATMVQSRNSDRKYRGHVLLLSILTLCSVECAKRWTDTLNPAIDRTTWSTESVGAKLQNNAALIQAMIGCHSNQGCK